MIQEPPLNKAANPLEPHENLKSPSALPEVEKEVHPQKIINDEDSAVTKAEKIERHGEPDGNIQDSPTKRIKFDISTQDPSNNSVTQSERPKGVAPIKAESVSQGSGVWIGSSQRSDF